MHSYKAAHKLYPTTSKISLLFYLRKIRTQHHASSCPPRLLNCEYDSVNFPVLSAGLLDIGRTSRRCIFINVLVQRSTPCRPMNALSCL